MNKLIKGNLIMTNVADKDIDMYVNAGWKLETIKKETSSKEIQKKFDESKTNIENESTIRSDIVKE